MYKVSSTLEHQRSLAEAESNFAQVFLRVCRAEGTTQDLTAQLWASLSPASVTLEPNSSLLR